MNPALAWFSGFKSLIFLDNPDSTQLWTQLSIPGVLEEGMLIILIDCMIFLPPFLDVTTMISMSKVSFLAQLDSGILCLFSVPIPRHKSRLSHVNVFLDWKKIITKWKRNKNLKMPSLCAVFKCSNRADREKDKSNYRFP